MKEGLVSIVTPTYNSVEFIRETISSIQQQTYNQWELLLIDDCSADNTLELINELAVSDARIKVFSTEVNSGAGVARNLGIAAANGQYLTFIDADDLWFPNFIENSIKMCLKQQASFVFSSYRRSDEHLNFIYSDFIVPKKVTYHDILKTNSISCLTAFLDVGKLEKKFMPKIRKRQDMGLWLSYLKEIPFAVGIETPMAIYRIRENSLSRDKKALIKYQWEFYTKVEKLNYFASAYYMLNWMYLGYKKYKD